MNPITKELLEQLCRFETALIANTAGAIDATPVEEWYMGGSIQSVTPEIGPTVGVAYTCELDTSTPGGTPEVDGYWRLLELMDKDPLPSVLVVRTVGSRPDHECVLGDGMAKSLLTAGCIGSVADAGVRDVPGLLAVGFAAYSRGKTIHHGVLRFRNVNCPVEVGGITVRPGDVIHADSGGVIRIPPGCIGRLPGECARMIDFERDVHELCLRKDVPLAEKRRGVQEIIARYGFQKTPAARGEEVDR